MCFLIIPSAKILRALFVVQFEKQFVVTTSAAALSSILVSAVFSKLKMANQKDQHSTLPANRCPSGLVVRVRMFKDKNKYLQFQ